MSSIFGSHAFQAVRESPRPVLRRVLECWCFRAFPIWFLDNRDAFDADAAGHAANWLPWDAGKRLEKVENVMGGCDARHQRRPLVLAIAVIILIQSSDFRSVYLSIFVSILTYTY